MSDLFLEVPRELRRGKKAENELESVATGEYLIELMCRNLGLDSFAGVDVLDMGCGVKLVQAFLDRGLPVGRYVGVDVYAELIRYLQSNVSDERFAFHVADFQNDMYNPGALPLSEESRLPIEEESFDLICLFSVFTHLTPQDYGHMLKLLRRYIKPDGRILYSLFVNETTAGGHGYIDRMLPFISASLSDEDVERGVPDFVDWDPEHPLNRAIFSREYALKLVEGTGWEVESLNDPEECIQHYMICKPI